ncbi:MAG: S24/S26 family peptidase [Clostridiales bacterium]|nr:S24/S26 family peptidase [Clostridiales bacterium]
MRPAFFVSAEIRFFVGYVPAASIDPAIRKDSFIFGVRVVGDLERGDVVAFEYEGRVLVKRIAALL